MNYNDCCHGNSGYDNQRLQNGRMMNGIAAVASVVKMVTNL